MLKLKKEMRSFIEVENNIIRMGQKMWFLPFMRGRFIALPALHFGSKTLLRTDVG